MIRSPNEFRNLQHVISVFKFISQIKFFKESHTLIFPSSLLIILTFSKNQIFSKMINYLKT